MNVTILTLFPKVFEPLLTTSIIKRAKEKGIVQITLVNIRDFALGSYKTVDDRPYGGGTGMVMRVDILYKAVASAKCPPAGGQGAKCRERIILTDPKGRTFNQQKAKSLAKFDHLIIICGHYEGVDARIENYIDEVVSIGDFVLTGGEIPAMIIVDSVVRLLPGVLPKGATEVESFEKGLLEYPQYTRPAAFRGKKAPHILLSGNHKKIQEWRRKQQRKA